MAMTSTGYAGSFRMTIVGDVIRAGPPSIRDEVAHKN
jgi:hypothetical protein